MAPHQHRKSKLDPYIEKVGVVPDAEVAALAGVTVDNVRAYRRRRGIPAGWRGAAKPLADEQAAPGAAVAVPASPEPKKATKKRKASKPKAKKPAAKLRKASAKKPDAEPAAEPALEVEQVPAAMSEVEPEADATPAPAEVPPPDLEQPVEAEAAMAPAPVPPRAPKQRRKTAKPKAKKPATKTPRAKKPKAVPAPEPGPEVAPVAAVVVKEEPEVEAVPAPTVEPPPEPEQIMEPEVVAEPADDLPAAPAPRARPIRQHRRSKLDAYLDKLGLIPDAQVANLAGVTPENVRVYRVRRGIPARWRGEGEAAPVESVPFPKATTKPAKGKASSTRRARRGKLTPFMDQIGIVPDARIAELSGTTTQNVRAFRLRHGIPARWRGEGEPLASEEAAVVPALVEELTIPAAVAKDLPPESDGAAAPVEPVPTALLEAYVITVEGAAGAVEYAVVGKDIVEATTTAAAGMARAGIAGKLVAVRFMARMLGG